jgi:hypothetical protein
LPVEPLKPDDVPASPVFDASLTAEELVARGNASLDAGELVAARYALNAALGRTTSADEATVLRDRLAQLNAPVFLGSDVLPDDPAARFIDIMPGDSFLRLGNRFGLTAAYLQAINPSLNARNLKPLTGVKVVSGPFNMHLAKQAGRLDVYVRDLYLGSVTVTYPEGNDLPRGEYRIAAATKFQTGGSHWIGYESAEPATERIAIGWMFGSAGPRGNNPRDRVSGIRLNDSDLTLLYNVLVESRSRLTVDQ